MPAAVIPSPSANFKIVMALSPDSDSCSLASSRALCFRISTRSDGGELLITEVQQLEDIFKFPDVQICALRADGLSKELLITRRPKSWDYCIKDDGDTSQGSTHIPSRVQMRLNSDVNSTIPCHVTKNNKSVLLACSIGVCGF